MTSRRERAGLRHGFTTGSAAAAAAKAALTLLLAGGAPRRVDIPLPGASGGRLEVDVARAGLERGGAFAVVVKDAGDDPDATHGAHVGCLALLGETGELSVTVEGGPGVGRVTLPGLPVPVGQAAINPAPRAQIELAAREALAGPPGWSGAVRLVVEVENGEAIARHTLNARLGITGGISILGTQGIVKPFSHEAWRATIDSGLEVARAAGLATAALSTGRRSERALMAQRPELPELAFVQGADFFAHATAQAARLGFGEIVWGCYFGKLVKMAQGLAYTHARSEPTDFSLLASLAALAGADASVRAQVAQANTARHALELAPDGEIRTRFAALAAQRALEAARRFAGSGPRLEIVCFGFESGVLARAYTS